MTPARDPRHFDTHAADYERHRPAYPDALWARLEQHGVLRPGARVLDLGAGTGEASHRLVSGGATVTAVEPGPALAARLRRRVPEARVLEATVEEADLGVAAHDAAVIATAVHWFDLDVVLPRLHRALVPGGRLAVWRTVFGVPGVATPFRDRVDAIVARRGDLRPVTPLDTRPWARALTAGGLFAERDAGVFRWRVDLDPDQVRGLFSTFSDWTEDEVEAAAAAARDLGGRVTEHYATMLTVLDRVSMTA